MQDTAQRSEHTMECDTKPHDPHVRHLDYTTSKPSNIDSTHACIVETTDLRISENVRNIESPTEEINETRLEAVWKEGGQNRTNSELSEGYREVEDHSHLWKEKVNLLENELKASKASHKRIVGEREKMIRDQEEKFYVLESSHNRALQLLETRTSELRAAQAFLSKEDSRSVADVVQLVQDLNSEIIQASALLVESLPFDTLRRFTCGDRTKANENLSALLGTRSIELLAATRGAGDMNHLEVVFQGCMSTWAHRIINAWHFGTSFGNSEFFDDVYEKIRSSEEQAIAGRWRAITRRNLQVQLQHLPSNGSTIELIQSLSSYIAQSLVDAVTSLGFVDKRDKANGMVKNRVGRRLETLATLAHRLNIIIGQDIISGDIETMLTNQKRNYDASFMDDTHGGNKDVERKRFTGVICTTELGLLMTIKLQRNKRKTTVLLKQKVALEGYFKD